MWMERYRKFDEHSIIWTIDGKFLFSCPWKLLISIFLYLVLLLFNVISALFVSYKAKKTRLVFVDSSAEICSVLEPRPERSKGWGLLPLGSYFFSHPKTNFLSFFWKSVQKREFIFQFQRLILKAHQNCFLWSLRNIWL